MDNQTAQALIRFGLGRRGSQPIPTDPSGWLAAQITGADPGSSAALFADLPTSAAALVVLREDRKAKPPPGQGHIAPLYRQEAGAAAAWAVRTDAPFRERLVWFWANHFCVGVRAGAPAAVAGAYVREAIRPHVTGRFADLLLAVMHHPAMLLYLDNAQSVGPDSVGGQRSHRGLNENLARECLELHTVSPAAGYSQADVTAFARVLTGWSIDLNQEVPGWRFRPFAHEPGAQMVMGQSFDDGEQGGIEALTFLANHPATHRHLATKLVRHFVADVPPPDAVRHIEGVLRDTKGDLGQASLALIRLPEAWQPGTKLRTPQDYVIATMRAMDLPADKQPFLPAIMTGLGQQMWNPPLPNGWGDTAADWSGPETMLRRVDWAHAVAGRGGALAAADVAEAALGPLLRPETATAIRQAGSRWDALTMVFASPEFQRR